MPIITPAILSDWAREFGVLTSVLFLVLLTGITFMWFLVGKLSRTVDEIKLILVERTREFLHIEGLLSKIDANDTAFLGMQNTITLHAKACELGQAKIAEVTGVASGHGRLLEKTIQQLEMNAAAMAQALKDLDVIGKSVGELVAIIRDRIKEGRNDGRNGNTVG